MIIDCRGISCTISLSWLSLDHADDKSTLVQVTAWCRQATSHYLSQCWPRSLSPYGVTRPQWVKEIRCYTLDQSDKSHVPVPYPAIHPSEPKKCTYFCSEWCILRYEPRCIVGFVRLVCSCVLHCRKLYRGQILLRQSSTGVPQVMSYEHPCSDK